MTKTTKVTMNLSEESINNLEAIHEILKCSNKTTALASALELANELYKQKADGKEVLVVDGDYQRRLIF